MMRGMLTILSFISVMLFPWPLTAIIVLVSSFSIPLLPLSVGIFADTLYYTPQANILPLCSIFGAIATGAAFFVRSRLRTSNIGR
ncbi:MAG: hypothetical protein V1711_00170 [bacterium]